MSHRLAPIVIDERCTACGLCLATCPEHALRAAPGRPRLLAWRCTKCLACIEICPVDAIAETATAGQGIARGRQKTASHEPSIAGQEKP